MGEIATEIAADRDHLDLAGTVALVGPSGPLSMDELDHYRIAGPNSIHDEWNPKKITHRHHRICQLAALGESVNSICEIMDYTPTQVSKILSSETGQDLIAIYQREMQDRDAAFQARLRSVRDHALEKLEDDIKKNLVHGKDLNSAIFGLMDRSGFGPGRTVDIHSTVGLDDETREALEAYNAQQARIISDPIQLGVSSKELEARDRGIDMDRVIEEASSETDPEGDDPGAKSGDSTGKSHRKVSKKVGKFLELAASTGSVD